MICPIAQLNLVVLWTLYGGDLLENHAATARVAYRLLDRVDQVPLLLVIFLNKFEELALYVFAFHFCLALVFERIDRVKGNGRLGGPALARHVGVHALDQVRQGCRVRGL